MKMIVGSPDAQQRIGETRNAIIVSTPLDAIVRLEGTQPIMTVVLRGSFASDRAFIAFLAESYPGVRIEEEV